MIVYLLLVQLILGNPVIQTGSQGNQGVQGQRGLKGEKGNQGQKGVRGKDVVDDFNEINENLDQIIRQQMLDIIDEKGSSYLIDKPNLYSDKCIQELAEFDINCDQFCENQLCYKQLQIFICCIQYQIQHKNAKSESYKQFIYQSEQISKECTKKEQKDKFLCKNGIISNSTLDNNIKQTFLIY